MTPLEALTAARAIIADPAHFTRSHSARSRPELHGRDLPASGDPGDPISPLHRDAYKWDASGALMKATGRRRNCPGFGLLVEAAGGFRSFVEITTRGTHADTLALYDRAMAKITPVRAQGRPSEPRNG